MLLLRIINAVAVFNFNIFASDIYILTRNNSTAFNVSSLICIQVHIAFNTANCASHLLSILVGVLVLLLFLANGKAQATASKHTALLYRFSVFAFACLLRTADIQIAAGFYAYVIICNYVAACNIRIFFAANCNFSGRNITADNSILLTIIVNIRCFGRKQSTDLVVLFVQALVVFCCISDIYIIFGNQVGFSCFTGYVAAFYIDIFAACNADIVLRCYSSALHSFIYLLVMVVIAAATLANLAFLAVQIFHSSQAYIAFSIQLYVFFRTQNTTCYANVLFSIQADVLAAQRALLVLHVMNFC